jgi:hypothetical protein
MVLVVPKGEVEPFGAPVLHMPIELVLKIIIVCDLTYLLNVSFRAKYLLQKLQQKFRSFI